MTTTLPVVVGSRSPRRLELLRTIMPDNQLIVCPPRDSNEAGFDGLRTLDEIEQRVREIVAVKRDDVLAQLPGPPQIREPEVIVVAADTTVVVPAQVVDEWTTLGQPPADESWRDVVREWFRNHLAGRTHVVMSGVSVSRVCLEEPASRVLTAECVCRTRVTMRSNVDDWIEWYLATGEPLGKAGGYAIQGAGSVFVTQVEGSLSNVIGLPLEDTVALLQQLGQLRSPVV